MSKIKVGFIGTGDVMLKYYLPAALRAKEAIEVVSICDALAERAAGVAHATGTPEVYGDYQEMLARTSADLIVNLTPAQWHYPITQAALEAGKHVYVEKPLARTLEEADQLIALAKARGVQLMAAPSLMLDPVNRALHALIRDEVVGKVAFVVANSFNPGPLGPAYLANYERALASAGITVLNRLEDKTDPSWFYQKGGGPLYDAGVYKITQLTGLLGPAIRVTALSGIRTPERLISGGVGKGRTVAVDEDDNTLVLLDFGHATFAFVSASWHGSASESAQLEAICQEGTISLPRGPRGNQGVIKVHRNGHWEEVTIQGNPWILSDGLPYLADCILGGKVSMLTIEQSRHVVEIMEKALISARTGQTQILTTTFSVSTDDHP